MTAPARARPPLFSAGLGYYARALHKAISRSLALTLAEQGIALKHYYYLRSLFEEDHISQVELSKRVGMEKATVARVMDTMEREDLVRRTRDPDDRRIVNVSLTPRAKRLETALRASLDRVNRQFLGDISESEYAAFRATVLKMLANAGESL